MMESTEGHIRLALLQEHVPVDLVLGALPAFRKTYPRIRFTISYEPAASIEEGLISERLSFAVLDHVESHDFVQSFNCGALDFVTVASKRYVAAHPGLDRPEAVLLADLIDLAPDLPLVRSYAGSKDPKLGTTLQQIEAAFIVPSFHAAHLLMLQGAGVAFLPRQMMAAGLASGELVELTPEHRVVTRPLQVFYRRRNTRQLYESLFIEHLMDLSPLGSDKT
jgi:DNA-binding transcriptional LysR family regulator